LVLEAARVNHRNSGVPYKVPRVEREQVRYLMDMHGRNKARVVHLYAGNRMVNQQAPPLMMHSVAVFEKSELFFYKPSSAIHLKNRQAVPVPLDRTSTRIPKLSQILRCIAKVVTVQPQPSYNGSYNWIIAVIWLDEPQQHICVDQIRGHSERSW
jgi:hypothetical protein